MRYEVLECDRRPTRLGWATRIYIQRHDGKPMPWREVWEVFASRYPDRWAVQAFPPFSQLRDEAHKYHLYVLDQTPREFDIVDSAPAGTVTPASLQHWPDYEVAP